MAAGRLTHTMALAGRSVRADENRVLMHILRGAVMCFLTFLIMVGVWEMGSNDAPGQLLFFFICLINLASVVLASVAFFPSTITEEKEARTLGLLRMADVGPMAIIAGKVMPRLGIILVLLAIQIPIVLLAITLGGVTWEQVVRAFLTLMLTSLTLCALATLFSVVCKSTRNSSSLLVVFLIITPISLWLTMWIIAEVWGYSTLSVIQENLQTWLWPLLPITHLFEFAGGTTLFDPQFVYFVSTHLVASALLFLIGWVLFDRAIDSTGQAELPRPVGLKLMTARERSSRRAWSKSLAWKDYWFVGGGIVGFGIRMVLYPLLAVGVAALDSGSAMVNVGDYLFGITLGCIPIELAIICSRVFRHDLDNFTWSSLLMLPRTLGGVVGEKLLGCVATLIPSVGWFCFSFLLEPEILRDIMRDISREPEVLFAILMMVAQVITGSIMITYFSLRTRYGAIPFTIFVLGIGNIVYWMFIGIIAQPRDVSGPLMFNCFICFVTSVILLENTRKTLVMLGERDG